jgi:hyperosmotically inducible protein
MIQRNHLFTLLAAAILTSSAGAWAAGERSGTTKGEATGTTGETRDGTMGEAANDTWLTTKVKSALLADQATSGLDVQVETENGVVQLSGFVSSETEKQRAEEVARSIKGVKQVKNDLRLKGDQR